MRLKEKKSYRQEQNHLRDGFENLGFKYWEKGILDKVISPELFSNPFLDGIYRELDRLLVELVNLAKQVRTQYSIAHDKDTININ